MFGKLKPTALTFARSVSRKVNMANEVHLSNRRVMRKIKMGKARPAIFHQFETWVELSDGSVVSRRSQAPKDEIRMITDQKNSSLWNPTRSDLVTADPNATGRVNQFKKRFSGFESDEQKDDAFLDLLGKNAQEVQKGGKVLEKRRKQ